jgi:hypothetical protein
VSDEDGVDAHSRLSWRDMLTELANAETRITAAIEKAVAPLAASSNDHEERLRKIETGELPWVNRLAEDANRTHEKHGKRIGELETSVGGFISREKGVALTLGLGKQLLLVIAATAGLVVTLVSIFDRLAPT